MHPKVQQWLKKLRNANSIVRAFALGINICTHLVTDSKSSHSEPHHCSIAPQHWQEPSHWAIWLCMQLSNQQQPVIQHITATCHLALTAISYWILFTAICNSTLTATSHWTLDFACNFILTATSHWNIIETCNSMNYSAMIWLVNLVFFATNHSALTWLVNLALPSKNHSTLNGLVNLALASQRSVAINSSHK